MAIDQSNKALNIASNTVAAAEQFMAALTTLQALEIARSDAGITLSAFDATFATSAVKQGAGADFQAVLTNASSIATTLKNNGMGAAMNKVRP